MKTQATSGTSLHRRVAGALDIAILAAPPAVAQLPTTVGTPLPVAMHFSYAPPDSLGIAAERLAPVADQIVAWVEEGLLVGGELLIVKDRRIVYHEAFGWRDRERNLPWERNTIGRLRSMTKPFVGTSIQMLADEGRIALDDPVARYLPSFDNERSREITITQLLQHTGGFTQPGYPAALTSYGSLMAAGQLPPFGHGGSDGTFAWADPRHDLIVIYFTQSRGGTTVRPTVALVTEALGM